VASGDPPAYRVSLQPEALFVFLERFPEHGPGYVLATAEMIRRDYPDCADKVLPRLRQIYRAKLHAERVKK